MSSKTQSVTLEQTLKTSPAQVYHAFTNATALREWMCDVASADPHPGGRLYWWWNSGYYAVGEFTKLEKDKEVAFTWYGRGDLGPTPVIVAFVPKGEGTLVRLIHSGGPDEAWAETAKKEWGTTLENLVSVLETGRDLRFVRRPMMGISMDEFDAEVAAKLGVPASEGIRLSGTMEGMGAQKAGLQKDDVIVRLGEAEVIGWPSLVSALQAHRAGDKIEVVFYRRGEKKTVTMELSARPLPEIPPTGKALAESLKKVYAELDAELSQVCAEVSEADASRKPAPTEWSAKETLAHLIHTERGTHDWVDELIDGQERWADSFSQTTSARLAATIAAYSTLPAMLEEFRRNQAEMVAHLAALPEEFLARKGSYWRMAYNLLQMRDHIREHIAQMRAALENDQSPHL